MGGGTLGIPGRVFVPYHPESRDLLTGHDVKVSILIKVDQLNQIPFFGFKLGFWWAQQGSIYVFIGLIFYYVRKMKQIDKTFEVSDDEEE